MSTIWRIPTTNRQTRKARLMGFEVKARDDFSFNNIQHGQMMNEPTFANENDY
jgi:hypothetical protein